MDGNADEKEMSGGRRWLLLGMACACTMLTFLNMGCITAATPDLSGTFVVGTLDVSWSGAACPLERPCPSPWRRTCGHASD